MLCYIFTFDFKTSERILDKIQEYIITYKKLYRMPFSERAAIDDSPEIDIDNLDLRDDSDKELVENENDCDE